MTRLVFDIETSALPVGQFDEVQQEYLFREAQRLDLPSEQAAKREEITRMFSLWPLTGQVVCIAMLNVDTSRGQVLYIGESLDDPPQNGPANLEHVVFPDEPELLEMFWRVAARFDSVITFNGRGFDVPFLYLRSAVLNVPISRKDWLGYRYQTEPHCDLAEQLTFYGVSGREGAGRRFNLDFYCKAFGLPSPKSQGVTGQDITALMAAGRHREIAEYCFRDVEATAQLYRIWKERLAGVK